MSYIGNSPITAAFLTDTFSGNGSTTAFTMSIAPAGPTSCIVAITGVVQDPSTYSTSGTTLTFSAAPPPGTNNISVRYLGIPASGVTTTSYRTLTETTATAGQTSFSVPSYTVGFINVYRNGALLGTADYTATTGTTVVLATGATAGDLVVVESFYVSSVLNALPQTGGSLSGNLAVVGTVTSTGAIGSNGSTVSGASLVAGRVDSGSEGGQLDLCRSSDNTSAWAVDVYGSTSTPSFRIVDNVAGSARMTIDSAGVITGSAGNLQLISGTSQTASGTAVDFTGIPSWVKRITVMIAGVTKSSGTSGVLIRLGTSGGFVSSGYASGGAYTGPSGGGSTQTAGFPFGSGYGAGDVMQGNATITNITGNTWVWSSIMGQSNNGYVILAGGSIALGGTLTQLRLTNITGTDTFGGGTINILYE